MFKSFKKGFFFAMGVCFANYLLKVIDEEREKEKEKNTKKDEEATT